MQYALAGCEDVDITEPLGRLALNVWDYDESLYQILDLLTVAGRQECFEETCDALRRATNTPHEIYEAIVHTKIIENMVEGMPVDELYSLMLAHRGELDLVDDSLMDLAHRCLEPGVGTEARLLEEVPEDIASAMRFAAWLHREKGIPSCLAERHFDSIKQWIQHLNNDQFVMEFSRTAVVDFIDGTFMMMRIYLDCLRALQTCQAIYDFGEYLNALDVPGKPDLGQLRETCCSVIDEISMDREVGPTLDILKRHPAYNLLAGAAAG